MVADGFAVEVDVLDRLPTPYGLVRYGVAPDHPSIKSIAGYLRQVLEVPQVRFLGSVDYGKDVTREELLTCYDAVVYATGAMRDRRLGVPGEDLPGSFAAADFVRWYCGHPDIDPAMFRLDAESVAVIGAGNVAIDVARVLAKTAAELSATDVPEQMLAALAASRVREIHVIARRGPAQAKFTVKELRELGELPNAEIVGTDRVTALRLERTRLDESGLVLGTGHYESLPVQMVLRSVGYRGVPLPGVPFDESRGTVPNAEGRVLGAGGCPRPGEYVAGWLKRGPTGVIGTNKSDAAQTVRSLLADYAGGGRSVHRVGAAAPRLADLLAGRGVRLVSYADWLGIDKREQELAAELGRGERVKLCGWEALDLSLRPSKETPAA